MWVTREMPRTRKGKYTCKYFQNQGKKSVELLPSFTTQKHYQKQLIQSYTTRFVERNSQHQFKSNFV